MVQLPSAPSESGNSRFCVGGGLLRLDQHDAGLAGHGVGGRVDLADAVHALEREQDLAVVRRLPADQAGVAALRHDRRAGLVRELEDGGDLGGRARPQHHRRAAVIEPAILDQVGLDIVRVGERVALADDGGEAGEEFGRDGFDGAFDDVHAALSRLEGADYSADLARLVHARILLRPHPDSPSAARITEMKRAHSASSFSRGNILALLFPSYEMREAERLARRCVGTRLWADQYVGQRVPAQGGFHRVCAPGDARPLGAPPRRFIGAEPALAVPSGVAHERCPSVSAWCIRTFRP